MTTRVSLKLRLLEIDDHRMASYAKEHRGGHGDISFRHGPSVAAEET